MKIELLGHTCIGTSHIANRKPCQDASISYSWENGSLIVVSDGHGSDKYFRSDRGSKIAVEVAKKAIVSFVDNFKNYESIPNYKARGISGITNEKSDDYTPYDYDYETTFRHLFDFIVSEWFRLITEDWRNDPPTEEEYSMADSTKSGKVKQFYNITNPNIAKAYGCTLIAAVRTENYWFAFQLGDGTCIAFKEDGAWFEPIPWDSRCFLNQTTSLSGQGSESFRYCIGTKHVPALFIATDGLDDSYPPISCLAKWYKLILKKIEEHNVAKVQKMLVDFLPQLSKQGSKDDMSLRIWIDSDITSNLCHNIILKEIKEKKDQCNSLEQEIKEISTDIFMTKNDIEKISGEKNDNCQIVKQKKSYLLRLLSSIEQLKEEIFQKESDYRNESETITQKENEINKQNLLILTEGKKIAQAEQNKKKKLKELDIIKQDIVALEKLLQSRDSTEIKLKDKSTVDKLKYDNTIGSILCKDEENKNKYPII